MVANFDCLSTEEFVSLHDQNREQFFSSLKSKKDLIVSFDFKVRSYSCDVSSVYHSPQSETLIDGSSPTYVTGQRYTSSLGVWSPSCPIEKLLFPGYLSLEVDDYIRAFLLKGIPVEEILPSDRFADAYVERSFDTSERALRIQKLCRGEVASTWTDKDSFPT